MRNTLVSLLALLPLAIMADGYKNPIIPGYHPDPSVCRVGDKFYLVNSSFHYFPGVPIYESTDLVNWTQIGNVLDRKSQIPLKNGSSWLGIYAPTIRYNDGTYYMITTNVGNGGNFMVTATDPGGPWSEPIWLQQQGIDPSLLFENGKCYMVSNPDATIMLCEIDPVTGEQLTESRAIWRGTGGRHPEGPHIYSKDGYYYLLISEGGTELAHKLTIARSKDIYGPYEGCPDNPILTHCRMAAQYNPIQGTGHGDLVQADDGSWWMVFLGFRFLNGSYHHLGRETFLTPVEWKEGEWPVVNGGNPIEIDMSEMPTIAKQSADNRYQNTAKDGFDNMGYEWLYIQNPDSTKYEHVGSAIRLYGSKTGISQNEGPTYLGRRQEAPAVEATTLIDAVNLKPEDEAGITIYQINNGHMDIAVKRSDDGSLSIIRRSVIMSLVKEEEVFKTTNNLVCLQIKSDGQTYTLSAGEKDGEPIATQPIECQILSTEVVGGFTGVTLGMYVQGTGSADFLYFDYKE